MRRATLLLLGDSTRLAYQSQLARTLEEDGIHTVGPAHSSGASTSLAEQVDAWIVEHQPDMCCFACGGHAAEATLSMVDDRGRWDEPVSLAQYERDLRYIAQMLTRFCGRQVVFVTAPPVHVPRLGRVLAKDDSGDGARAGGAGGDAAVQINRSIAQYNELAIGLLGQVNIGVADLHRELSRRIDECLGDDGVVLSETGIAAAAEVVSTGVHGLMRA